MYLKSGERRHKPKAKIYFKVSKYSNEKEKKFLKVKY